MARHAFAELSVHYHVRADAVRSAQDNPYTGREDVYPHQGTPGADALAGIPRAGSSARELNGCRYPEGTSRTGWGTAHPVGKTSPVRGGTFQTCGECLPRKGKPVPGRGNVPDVGGNVPEPWENVPTRRGAFQKPGERSRSLGERSRSGGRRSPFRGNVPLRKQSRSPAGRGRRRAARRPARSFEGCPKPGSSRRSPARSPGDPPDGAVGGAARS